MRIIDTPDIGDTRGMKQDKENVQNVLDHLATLDFLHGICILLKPNNARLDIMFEYCIKGLLKYLHVDTCQNIVCITNFGATFYRPGDTLPLLRVLLADSNADIPMNEDTCYCIDSEGLRCLAAIRQGHPVDA